MDGQGDTLASATYVSFWQIVLQKSAIGEGLIGIQQDVEAIAEPRPEEGPAGRLCIPMQTQRAERPAAAAR